MRVVSQGHTRKIVLKYNTAAKSDALRQRLGEDWPVSRKCTVKLLSEPQPAPGGHVKAESI